MTDTTHTNETHAQAPGTCADGAIPAPPVLGDLTVSPLGFGAMAVSHVYGGGLDDAQARAVVNEVIDAGITLIDTADVYGEPRPGTQGPAGTNEEMLAPLLKDRRGDVQLATKFGLGGVSVDTRAGSKGASIPVINGRPEYVAAAIDASLSRLGVDFVDLYYLHRPDPQVPIEETVGAMGELVAAGKVGELGLSEVTADEIRRAQATHPIAAVQSEWSVWSRDVERHVVPACAELGIGFVPYSPLGRGFLTGTLSKETVSQDFRGSTERMGAGWDANQAALRVVTSVAGRLGASPAQVSLAWLLAKGAQFGLPVVPIPGSRKAARMVENLGAVDVALDEQAITDLDSIAGIVEGGRNITPNKAFLSNGRE